MERLTFNLVAGDTLDKTFTVPDYPADTGWTLEYIWLSSQKRYTQQTIASGPNHLLQVTAEITGQMIAGAYTQTVRAIKGAEIHTLDRATVQVFQNPLAGQPQDLRSEAEVMVEAIRAAMVKMATTEQLGIIRTRHNVTEVEISMSDLRVWLDYWQAILNREIQAESIARGYGDPSVFRVRFR